MDKKIDEVKKQGAEKAKAEWTGLEEWEKEQELLKKSPLVGWKKEKGKNGK